MISHPMFMWAILIIGGLALLLGIVSLLKFMDLCDDVKTIRNLVVRDAKNGHPRINAPSQGPSSPTDRAPVS